MKLRYFISVTAQVSLGFSHSYPASKSPTVSLSSGPIFGTTTTLPSSTVTVNKFLGIPFAASPARFEAPEPPKPWKQPLNATATKPACIQAFIDPEGFGKFLKEAFNNAEAESEDCLYLNVYAAAAPPPPGGRAVMVFIYGGNFQFGSAGAIDGSHLAGYEEVVFVAANYRTNVFGFPPPSDTNVGFQDQRLALEWVQRNIRFFGGDPRKVTVFGQSAGAMSVDSLITSYPSDEDAPFRAAILESGQYSYLSPGLIDSKALYWDTLVAGVNCTDSSIGEVECVKKASVSAIRDIVERGELLFYPFVDNTTMIADPINARAEGRIAKVPVIEGTVQNEGRVNMFGQNNLTAFLQQQFGMFPEVRQAVLEAYPRQRGESDYFLISRIFSDFWFLCPQALHANATARTGTPTWRYYFNVTAPPNLLPPEFALLGTYHGMDTFFVFGWVPPFNATPMQYAQTNYMRRTWANFAKNPYAGPDWNQLGSASAFVVQDGSDNPIAVKPASWDLDLGVIGGKTGDVAGVQIAREAEVDSKCSIFLPLYKAVAEGRNDPF